MEAKPRNYTGEAVTVTFDSVRCIHAQECIKRLPGVFNLEARPWVQPDAAGSAAELVEVVERCPSGALTYLRNDGGSEETAPAEASITQVPDGPLYVRGTFEFTKVNGETVAATRAALCRCGQSKNKPFCDNTHFAVAFEGP